MDKAFWFYEKWGLKIVKYNAFEDFIIPLAWSFQLADSLKYGFCTIEATSLEGRFWNEFSFYTLRILLALYLYFFST